MLSKLPQIEYHPIKERVLDFDTEARPLSWYGGDFVTKEVTAIGAQFIGESEQYCWLLGEDDPKKMLEGFRELYDDADVVTGHFIRGYDLPVLNAMMVENNLPPLSPKMAHDTKNDLVKWSGMSKSQENIAAVLGVEAPKVSMDQAKWREANRLTLEGKLLTKRRVLGDVTQHIAMRQRLMELKLLKPPRMWRP